MSSHGDSFLKRTGKSLSILAFETTKHSRIMKKRMRITALQKEVKADLRDLGSLVFNAVVSDREGVLADEEVKILVENVTENNTEIERLRDSIARISRAKKHFEEGELDEEDLDDFDEPALEKPAKEEPVAEQAPAAEPESAPEVSEEPAQAEEIEKAEKEEPTPDAPAQAPQEVAVEEETGEPTLEAAPKAKRKRKSPSAPRKRAPKKKSEGEDSEK